MARDRRRREAEQSVRDLLGRVRSTGPPPSPPSRPAPQAQPTQPARPPAQPQGPPRPAPAQPTAAAQPAQPPRPSPPRPQPPRPPQPDPQVMNRLQSIEERLSTLDDIQGLSELLSIKYNPFLDLDEEELFEHRHDPRSLVRAQVSERPRDPVQAFRDLGVEAPSPQGVQSWASPGRRGTVRDTVLEHRPERAPAPEPEPEPEPRADPVAAQREAARRRREALSAPATDARGPALLSGNPDTLFHGRTAVTPGGARESFLAMHWFTYLSEGTDSSIIFLYLDYYHYVGWIDESSYLWLARLAEGVAKRREGAGWSDYGMDVARLSRNHLRNLRFLDKMLGTTLQHGEADYLRQTVDMLLMEDG